MDTWTEGLLQMS